MPIRPTSVRPKMSFGAAFLVMLALSLVPGSTTLADSSQATQTSPSTTSPQVPTAQIGATQVGEVMTSLASVRRLGNHIVIDTGGPGFLRPPETVCGACVVRFQRDGTVTNDRTCTRIQWVRKCDTLGPPSEGIEGFPDPPTIVVCRTEARIVDTFQESCLPLLRQF